jgi:hypothetical protein
MKKYFFILLSFQAFAQKPLDSLKIPVDAVTGKISYVKIEKLAPSREDVSRNNDPYLQNDLFLKAKSWVAKNSGDFNAQLKLEEKEARKLVFNISVPVEYYFYSLTTGENEQMLLKRNFPDKYTLFSTVTFTAKEHRYKLEATDWVYVFLKTEVIPVEKYALPYSEEVDRKEMEATYRKRFPQWKENRLKQETEVVMANQKIRHLETRKAVEALFKKLSESLKKEITGDDF